jgi:hypothetical protein
VIRGLIEVRRGWYCLRIPPPELGGEEGRREEGERGRNREILRTGREGKKGKGVGKRGDERGEKWAGTEAPP